VTTVTSCRDAPASRATDAATVNGLTNLTNARLRGSVVVMTLNLYKAKTQLSALVDQAAAGAEIVIAKNGRPLAKLVPFRTSVRRKPGGAKAAIWMAADFDAPLPAKVLAAFRGNGDRE
jgi:prevent-host-death family protein